MILRQALRTAADRLAAAGVGSPLVDARLIAAHLLSAPPLGLDPLVPVPAGFWEMVERRERREPLQHILGTAWFGPLELSVGPGVFIPRPETEMMAQWAVDQVAGLSQPVVVDACCGSGAIAEFIATSVPDAQVYGLEIDPTAVGYARRNATHAVILEADVTQPLTEPAAHSVDLVVCNPPYVPDNPNLQPEVYADPAVAVFGGPDGMSVIANMMAPLVALLAPGGWLAMEHDDTTADAVMAHFREHGLMDVTSRPDLTGRARFVTGRRRDDEASL